MRIRSLAFGLALLLTGIVSAPAQQLLPNGEQTFVDSNGQPLSSGSVYFYIPGTTQAKVTYQNQVQTVPNSNPVVLNSAGRAIVWGSGLYRQIVYDQFGNLIWDQITQGSIGSVNLQGVISGSTSIATCNGYFPINNSASAPITITMPVSPLDGDSCQMIDAGFNAATYQITFNFGSKALNSGGSNYYFNFSGQGITFTWSATVGKWLPS